MNNTTESIPCLQNIRDHALKHLESIAFSIQHHEEEIASLEKQLREANRCYQLAQSELDSALDAEE